MSLFRKQADCPELDQLLSAAPGSAAARHLATCPACRNEVAMYRSFEEAEVRPEEIADLDHVLDRMKPGAAPRPVATPGLWDRLRAAWNPAWVGGFVAAAAAVVIFVSMSGQLRTQRNVPVPASDSSTWRSSAMQFSTRMGDLDSMPSEVRWSAVPGASNYTVTLAEIDGTRVFYKKVSNSVLPVAGEVANLVESGKVYLVSVTAEDASGRVLGEVGPERIRIRTKR